MVAAIEEGRVIYSNIRKFIRYMISCNIGEVLTMFIGMLIGLPVVLLPIQILWVNLVTDGLPAIALGLEPPDEDAMDHAPRGMDESVFSNGLLSMMIFRGCIIGLSTLGVFISIFKLCGSLDAARTAAFFTLVLVQLIHVFECKSETKNLLHINILNNIPLILAVLLSLAMIVVVIYIPFLQPIFSTVALTIPGLLRVLLYSMIGPVLSVIIFRNKTGRRVSRHNTARSRADASDAAK
jgi:Ca2+-transporting ATPase